MTGLTAVFFLAAIFFFFNKNKRISKGGSGIFFFFRPPTPPLAWIWGGRWGVKNGITPHIPNNKKPPRIKSWRFGLAFKRGKGTVKQWGSPAFWTPFPLFGGDWDPSGCKGQPGGFGAGVDEGNKGNKSVPGGARAPAGSVPGGLPSAKNPPGSHRDPSRVPSVSPLSPGAGFGGARVTPALTPCAASAWLKPRSASLCLFFFLFFPLEFASIPACPPSAEVRPGRGGGGCSGRATAESGGRRGAGNFWNRFYFLFIPTPHPSTPSRALRPALLRRGCAKEVHRGKKREFSLGFPLRMGISAWKRHHS